jgi:hypothetical protein
MADRFTAVPSRDNGQASIATVLASDLQILLNAAGAEGISVMALVGAAGSIESALNWARENQPPVE